MKKKKNNTNKLNAYHNDTKIIFTQCQLEISITFLRYFGPSSFAFLIFDPY